MERLEPALCTAAPMSSTGLHQWACIPLQKLVLYSRNKASRRQMSSAAAIFSSRTDGKIRQYAFQNYTEITRPRVCLLLPVWLIPLSHLCWGVVAGQKRSGIVWDGSDGAGVRDRASLIAADWYQSTVTGHSANINIGGQEGGGWGRLGNDFMTMRDEQPAIRSASAGASLELRVLREMWEENKCLRSRLGHCWNLPVLHTFWEWHRASYDNIMPLLFVSFE